MNNVPWIVSSQILPDAQTGGRRMLQRIAYVFRCEGKSTANFYRAVLTPNFPAAELISEEELIGGLRAGVTRVLAVRAPDGTILGGAVGDWFQRSRVQLLSYIAVRPGLRGQGIGSMLLTAAVRAWTAELEPLLIVAEVKDPRYHHDTEFGDASARVRLYERFGARALQLPYTQPAVKPNGRRVPHLMLMVFSGEASAYLSDGHVDGGIVKRFIREYFEMCEGPELRGDDELAAMFAACHVPGGLPLRFAHELPRFEHSTTSRERKIPMTGPEHYREAEEILEIARTNPATANGNEPIAVARATAHAILALAAATALNDGKAGVEQADWDAWSAVAGMLATTPSTSLEPA
jgi:GNAT superfamily N-acetyltransferase